MEDLKEKVLDAMLDLDQNYVPTYHQFKQFGYDDLYKKIIDQYGSLTKFCESNYLCTKQEYKSRLRRVKNRQLNPDCLTIESKQLYDEIERFIADNNFEYMPTLADFKSKNALSLYRRIFRYFSSVHEVREMLGLQTIYEWRKKR